MTFQSKSRRADLQGLAHGLRAVSILNRHGPLRLNELAGALAMPRASTYRIVQTLLNEGYCRRLPHSFLYALTPRARDLSDGVGVAEMLVDLTVAPLQVLGSALKWPLVLTTPRGRHMFTWLATDRAAPLALVRFSPGQRTPMLRSTTGVMHLALLEPEERERLLGVDPAMRTEAAVELAGDKAEAVLSQAAADGYVLLDGEYREGRVGVAVLCGGRPVGGIAMRYTKSALSREAVIADHLPRLRAFAADLSEQLEAAVAGVSEGRR